MRYLSLAEALLIAQAVTGMETSTLARVSRLELLDSALHAPKVGFGAEDFSPSFVENAAVLVVRIARNHPLPDGNKRLAWQALTMFCTLNDHELHVAADDAVMTMQAIAAGRPRRSRDGGVAHRATGRLKRRRAPRQSGVGCG